MSSEIWIVPFLGQGHMLPSVELSKQIAARNYKTTLIIPSKISSSIPSSLLQNNPLIHVAEIPSSSPSHPPPPFNDTEMTDGLRRLFLSAQPQPICAVVDIMMSWSFEIFKSFGVPSIGFFTSGACSAALEHATWKAHIKDIKPGEIRLLPGLPEQVASITQSDLKQRPRGPNGPPPRGPPPGGIRGPGGPPSGGPGGPRGPPPELGGQPPWMEEIKDITGLMINTCGELEGPFLDYLTNQIGKPVWGVGPLLPEQFYMSYDTLVHDGEIRSNRRSNVTEEEVITWLDSKPRGSVIYISFGTEVGPTIEEYKVLADALAETNPKWSFIWVIQAGAGREGPPGFHPDGYYPEELDKKGGERGMIICGWAPQLLILSHPSTGGFLSHCGWNSTVEAIGRGVPLLAWPLRGDQHNNARLVIKYLEVGYMISDDLSKATSKDDIVRGVERLMGDEDLKQRAESVGGGFRQGFPASSVASLEAFGEFVGEKAV